MTLRGHHNLTSWTNLRTSAPPHLRGCVLRGKDEGVALLPLPGSQGFISNSSVSAFSTRIALSIPTSINGGFADIWMWSGGSKGLAFRRRSSHLFVKLDHFEWGAQLRKFPDLVVKRHSCRSEVSFQGKLALDKCNPTTAPSKSQGGKVISVGEGRTIGKRKVDISVQEEDILGILDTDDVKDLKPSNQGKLKSLIFGDLVEDYLCTSILPRKQLHLPVKNLLWAPPHQHTSAPTATSPTGGEDASRWRLQYLRRQPIQKMQLESNLEVVSISHRAFAATMATAAESVQCFGRKKTAVAVAHCNSRRGLIKVNSVPIELVKPEILRLKAFEPILLLGRQRFMAIYQGWKYLYPVVSKARTVSNPRFLISGGSHQDMVTGVHASKCTLYAEMGYSIRPISASITYLHQVIDLTEQEEVEYWMVVSSVFEGKEVLTVPSVSNYDKSSLYGCFFCIRVGSIQISMCSVAFPSLILAYASQASYLRKKWEMSVTLFTSPYQSLHTAVQGPDNSPLEVQMRTQVQHLLNHQKSPDASVSSYQYKCFHG
ncbi:40S ribosomal protein S16 [Canna indica]|uniref:40S ribosomal protein S16 n=1 Tax=Canna indica TaxID=4628 RepID=A0AAQ3K683_9LILI|nr:40S ribosomal protein S16 [Canna indica]